MADGSNPHDLLAEYTHATPEAAAPSSSPTDQQPTGTSSSAQQPPSTIAGRPASTVGSRVGQQGELGWRLEPFEAGFSEGFAAGQRLARSLALGGALTSATRSRRSTGLASLVGFLRLPSSACLQPTRALTTAGPFRSPLASYRPASPGNLPTPSDVARPRHNLTPRPAHSGHQDDVGSFDLAAIKLSDELEPWTLPLVQLRRLSAA
jgi:hypothetical protein